MDAASLHKDYDGYKKCNFFFVLGYDQFSYGSH